MALEYDAALAALYQAPMERFVEERKRLAAELKASGDKDGGARLGRLTRPPLSAWIVNQLWWRERDAFEALLAAAERVRKGEHAAGGEHRSALAELRSRAGELLKEGGHALTDATLRRVTTSLLALAAGGGFAPDPAGALSADRESLGFEAAEGMVLSAKPEPAAAPVNTREEQARAKEERSRRLAERRRLEGAVQRARSELEARTAEVKQLEAELKGLRGKVVEAEAALDELLASLAVLEDRP
jgi:DNA repair exonuclease SbcCD ATPase subunit